MNREPKLTAATVIHYVVGDLLFQNKFGYAHFPEVVDLAVINTGLGLLQSSFGFVKQTSSFWDSTYWDASPRPFLDSNALAYANAVAAWVRGDKDPSWCTELRNEVKRPMQKSLKYLLKTNDSFFDPASANTALLKQSQSDWLKMASQSSTSTQLVAIRHMELDKQLADQQEMLLLEKLRSPVRPIVLHSISAVESLMLRSDPVANELRFLVESRDDELRAKAIIALAKLAQLDEETIDAAVKMIDSSVRYVVFAGVFALSSLKAAPDNVLRASERGFVRALQTCDYEFVGLFAVAMDRWLDDPQSHIEQLLQNDQPEYLNIATEALQNVRAQSVALKAS